MQKKLLFLASSLAFGLGLGNAQSQNIPFRNYCATDSMTSAAMDMYPDYARGRKEFTDMIKGLNNNPEAARIKKNGGKYTIPIVIHIMHTYGSNNITDAQVMDAVRIINEDYSKTSADTGSVISAYKPLHANVEFEFKLAQKDPQGNCTSGITRTYTPLTNNADNNVKNLIRWAPEKYLNIWVVDRISFGAGGYSYLPCNVPPNLEGVVILNTQFGSVGLSNGGNFSARSLTHEIGHYMGLPHVWGAGNTPGASTNCGMDDGIADTPNTVGSTNFSCNTASNSCTGTFPFPDPNGAMPDNVQNFMDYSSCAKMFTNGQKTVMVNALFNTTINSNCRNTLADSANLVATGTNPGFVPGACAPDVDFSSTSKRVCAGNIVAFQEQAYNLRGSAATYHWTFPGGSPATSTSPNPFVTYNTPGVYNVTLRVVNANGQDSLTKTNAVIVGSGNSIAGVPFIRGFEKANFPTDPSNPAESWEREVSGNNGWERTTSVAATGVGSLRVRNNIVTAGLTNALISPSISFYNVKGASLKFKLAHAQKTSESNERLVVSISEDCGNTWTDRYTKTGGTLATAPITASGNFSPQSASHWRQETVVIPNTFSGGNLMFKFEVTSDGGNPVYLDDIEINGIVSGMNESLASAANLNVYPNPSNGDATVSFALPTASDYTLEVLSVTGQQIGKSYVKQSQNGTQEIKLSNITGQQNLKAGVYLVKLQANGFTTLKKAIVF
ncbi:T9SS type A sorting domain-containing protein [Adhaeribacter sp. BT258]|uniref:T9SS type A sorting domain-containing protein n=1 Tax=Adhaeribacter terrigena TaxID=2793070 RepID=A0ABS1C169_9BACT|nr:M43 family zinc metalloprotease [Adhaeribacter terrigena]MBK0402921.1 T9SS type A sorting domain-containing protein [Adhaeribacter terrigena]